MLSAIVVSCTSADQAAAPAEVAPHEAAEQPVGGGAFHDRYAFLPALN